MGKVFVETLASIQLGLRGHCEAPLERPAKHARGHWASPQPPTVLVMSKPDGFRPQRATDNARERTRTSTGFYSHQHLKLTRLPISPLALGNVE